MSQEDINSQKKEVRKLIKERKKVFSPQQALDDSEKIFEKVERLPQFKEAKSILAYWSLPDEVSTHKFVLKWAEKKRFILPVVVGDTLELRYFGGLSTLVAGSSFGIQEPQTEEIADPKEVDFAIIPGIAFDLKGNRLGRGKGYYDRFLKLTNAFKVAVGFYFQILDNIPVDFYDVPVDLVITAKN